MITFGQRLRKLRKSSGLSQEELGSILGAYQSKYRNWENDINEPDFETLIKICNYFGVTTDYLLGREHTEPYPSEYEKEVHMLREEAKPYGSDGVKRLRKMLPLIFEKKP